MMNKTTSYPYLQSLVVKGTDISAVNLSGQTYCLSPKDCLNLYNYLLEDLWDYEARSRETQQDANEWLVAYEKLLERYCS